MFRIPALSLVPQVLLVACLLSVIYLVANTFITYRKLRHIPGPRLAAFSQLWLFNVTAKGDVYLSAEKVLREYGAFQSVLKWPSIDRNRLSGQNWSKYDYP